eukprot:jgi/Mesvir1/19515/Mv06893-RA.1
MRRHVFFGLHCCFVAYLCCLLGWALHSRRGLQPFRVSPGWIQSLQHSGRPPAAAPVDLPRMASSVLLPRVALPKKYVLELQPDMTTFTFRARVTIELDVLEQCRELTFHSAGLTYHSVEVENAGATISFRDGNSVFPSVQVDEKTQTAKLLFGDALLLEGTATMHVEYSGVVTDTMTGVYRAAYKDPGGVAKYLATTQFEAIDARQCLPCWDEPAYKAVYHVTLVAPAHLTCLCNMPVVDTKPADGGLQRVSFAPTPIMSSYLLAFVIGELERITDVTDAGVEINVYTTPGKVEQGRFALGVACKVLSFFNKLFGIPFPLPKCDLVAIPDFASGAMENWGLITFREAALLVDESSTAISKQRVAYVVSHELSHQWFGNLVTMAWWNDLWLNEGFATWVGWLGVAHVFPEWQVWEQFIAGEMSTALATDALKSSHPIEVPIEDPKDIQQVFDALSYNKGACVIRMLDAAIGRDALASGIRDYLNKHAYKNATTADLWEALGKASGKPVATMANSWTAQMGFPLVTVLPDTDAKAHAGKAAGGCCHLRQSRFLSAGGPSPGQSDPSLWWIPVQARRGVLGTPASEQQELSTVLSEREATWEMPPPAGLKVGSSSTTFLKLNAGQAGFYRVNYSPALWDALGAALGATPPALQIEDRLSLAMDSFALAKAGVIPTTRALQVAASIAQGGEGEYTVWRQLCTDLGELDEILSNTDYYPSFQAFGVKLFEKVAEKVGWEPASGESHLVSMLRPLVLSSLAKYGHADTVARCMRMFGEMTAGGKTQLTAVHPDLRAMVMKTAVENGGAAEYDALERVYLESTFQEMKLKCLYGLGATRDAALIQRFLQFGVSEHVRAQDILYVFAALAASPHGRVPSWQYVREHWSMLYERFHAAHGLLQHVVTIPLRSFASKERADEAEAFFTENPAPEARMALARALESIRTRAGWLERDGKEIKAWLQAHK